MWRWIIGKPEMSWREYEGNGSWRVRFPLELTLDERTRLLSEQGEPPDGVKQSSRSSYFVGFTLGYVDKAGQYHSTMLIDFLAAALGQETSKKFYKWIAAGGGYPRPADKDDQKAEIAAIGDWLGWWEGLELYGTVSHQADRSGNGVIWTRFAGPLPVGSLPGQKDPEYQAVCRGKFRIMAQEEPLPQSADPKKARTYDEIFSDEGSDPKQPVTATPRADGSPDLPF